MHFIFIASALHISTALHTFTAPHLPARHLHLLHLITLHSTSISFPKHKPQHPFHLHILHVTAATQHFHYTTFSFPCLHKIALLFLKKKTEAAPNLRPSRPDTARRNESVKELCRKRHSATQDVSFKGRERKVVKWKADPDDCGSEEESQTDSGHESTESDDEFQMCEICNSEEKKKTTASLFLLCTTSSSSLLSTSLAGCDSCGMVMLLMQGKKTDEYLQARDAYVAELLKRDDW